MHGDPVLWTQRASVNYMRVFSGVNLTSFADVDLSFENNCKKTSRDIYCMKAISLLYMLSFRNAQNKKQGNGRKQTSSPAMIPHSAGHRPIQPPGCHNPINVMLCYGMLMAAPRMTSSLTPRVCNLLPTAAWRHLACTFETYDCLLQYGDHVDIAKVTRCIGSITSSTKPEVHNVFH